MEEDFLQNTSKRNTFLKGIFIAVLLLATFSTVHAAYVITSLDFTVTPTAQTAKIGDKIYFNMAVLNSTVTYSDVTVVTVNASAIYISSPSFPALMPGAGIYVYDGTRTWHVTAYTPPSSTTIMLTDSELLPGIKAVSDYNTLLYNTFRGAQGTPMIGGDATVAIGTSVYGIQLFDDGLTAAHNDDAAADGVYNCIFTIRESYQFDLINGTVAGYFSYLGTNANNNGFIPTKSLNIDGRRPKINNVDASPYVFNPDKELLQIFYQPSENSTLTLKIYDSTPTLIKTLSASGKAGSFSQTMWDGLDSNGTLRTDGTYSYILDITDTAGNTGTSFKGYFKITSVSLETSLYSIDTQYLHTSSAQTVVRVNMEATLNNATSANMQNLGFNYADNPLVRDYRNYPYVYLDLTFYDNTGAVVDRFPVDTFTQSDTDWIYMDPNTPAFQYPMAATMTGFTLNRSPANPCAYDPLEIYTEPDGQDGNDWDNTFYFTLTNTADGTFTQNGTYVFYSQSMEPGTYIAAYKGILVGKSIYSVDVGGANEGSGDCVSGTTTVAMPYFYYTYHAAPSYFFDDSTGVMGDERGYGLSSQQTTSTFIVEQQPGVPGTDITPPTIVIGSEYPSSGTMVSPGEINTANYLKISLTDAGIGAGPTNLSQFNFYDPYGNQVPGKTAWNGGAPGTTTWELYYIPDSSITLGGTYSYTVVPVDAAYNIGEAVSYSFYVEDTAIPNVTGATVQSTSGSIVSLSPSTTTQVGMLVSKVNVTIMPGGTAAEVDWTNSTITVKSGTTVISGAVTHQGGTNRLVFTADDPMSDGSYTVNITAKSSGGYSGVTTYNFYITTAGVTYVNGSGTGLNSTTRLSITAFTLTSSGITDASSSAVTPTAITVANVAAASLPALPSQYAVINSAVTFSAGLHPFPLYFDDDLCTAMLRMHFTDTEAATLATVGVTPSELTLWVYDGAAWSQITGLGEIGESGTDNYIDVAVTQIPDGNIYALLYLQPPTPVTAYVFKSTKAFNPVKEVAKIYYGDALAKRVKANIYSTAGTLVRKIDSDETPALITGYDPDPYGSAVKYYLALDGKNDMGSYLRNGIYIIKAEVTKMDDSKSTISRTIAVIK